MTFNCCRIGRLDRGAVPIGAVLGLLLLLPGVEAHAVEIGVYQPPDLQGFVPIGSEMRDGDGDGVRETSVQRYQNLAADSIFSMSGNGRLWAWSLASRGEGEADLDRNYVIRDSDCDGSFDERYTLREEFRVPDCVK